MEKQKILHLIDDSTAGGVMRMLEHLQSLPELSRTTQQTVRRVKRNAFSWGAFDADVIVCHIAPSWRSLPAFATLRAMHPSVRLVHIEHSYTRAFTAFNVSHIRRFFAMLRVTYSLFDQVVAVSHNQAEWLAERRLATSDRLCVIQPEVDLSDFATLSPPIGETRTIGAIGRLEPQKGFDVLIKGFRLCTNPKARLIVFGDGGQRRHLEQLAAGDPRIEFRGHVSDLVEAYRTVDLVAMPSRWEAYGLVAEEARAASRPVIISNVDGLADRIGNHGVESCKFNPDSWAKTLERAMDKTPKCSSKRRRAFNNRAGHYAQNWHAAFGSADVA